MISKILKSILRHKVIAVVSLLLIIAGGYFGYQRLAGDKNTVQYVLAAVEKGTLIVSVSGSGQVSSLKQVSIKSSNSGDVIYVGVDKSQKIKEGTLIAKIDQADAQKALQDAQNNLKSAQMSLENMKGSDTLRGTKEKAEDDLENAYSDGFNTVVDIFFGLPTTIDGLKDITLGNALGSFNQWNIDYLAEYLKNYDPKIAQQYRDNAYNSYQSAKTAYNENLNDYKVTTITSDNDTIESLINETYKTMKNISEVLQNDNILYQAFRERLINADLKQNSLLDSYISKINSYITQANSDLTTLLSAKNNIQTKKENIINANYEIANQEIKVKQAEDALLNSQEKLERCSVYAPFDGIIAELNVSKGGYVSEGGAVATIITEQNLVEVTLNEVDAAKVKVGQKVTLTFDALPEVTISGKILEVDVLGIVTQGVVSYGVKIAFDAEVEMIKPGMSVTADIITDAKQDVLILPNSAIKSQGNSYYVELVEAPEEMRQQLLANISGAILPQTPKIQAVETGLSNDLSTEIVSGLNEGDIVVTSTISPNKVQTTQTQTNQSRGTQEFQIPGMMR